MTTIYRDLNGKICERPPEPTFESYHSNFEKTMRGTSNKFLYGEAENYIKRFIVKGGNSISPHFSSLLNCLEDEQLMQLYNRASEIFVRFQSKLQLLRDRTEDLKALQRRTKVAKRWGFGSGAVLSIGVASSRSALAKKMGAFGAVIISVSALAYTYLPYYLGSFEIWASLPNPQDSLGAKNIIQERIQKIQQQRRS